MSKGGKGGKSPGPGTFVNDLELAVGVAIGFVGTRSGYLKGTGNLLATEETRFVGIGCFELFVFLRVILASKLCKADALGSAKLGLAKVELDTLSPGKVTKGLASMCHPSHVPREDA